MLAVFPGTPGRTHRQPVLAVCIAKGVEHLISCLRGGAAVTNRQETDAANKDTCSGVGKSLSWSAPRLIGDDLQPLVSALLVVWWG
ncbi:hypothetical protein CCHOA_03990 [Corynebacterium choanae]|uniref:Uncharacterized protein n=2 Tax=Corynebacterium choanae TaxID=1862358 RepID=A0A3G6J596_9CORY|nr:hypothetical protein CCHOA_03990 [Corynebacterium choanae]